MSLVKDMLARYSPLAGEEPQRSAQQSSYAAAASMEDRFLAAALMCSNDGMDVESQIFFQDIQEKLSPQNTSPADKSEKFKINARVISDAIIGLSDGLTVPFALTAGLSTLGDTKVVLYGGMAELIAGGISMGLGGYLGAKSEQESYKATLSETRSLITSSPESVEQTVISLFEIYDIPSATVSELAKHLSSSPQLLSFLMRFQHTLPEPAPSRAITCALTIAAGYFFGGFIPLIPYIFVDEVLVGLCWSIGIMILALFAFGYVKTCFVTGWGGLRNGLKGIRGGVEMVFVGSVAAGAAMGLVVAFDQNRGRISGGS